MKKYVVAIDSMKGCLTSEEASTAFAEGILEASSGAVVTVVPVADGGEGTACVLAKAVGSTRRMLSRVSGPDGVETDAEWWYDDVTSTAFIDLAQSSGLTLVRECERNPLQASSFGFGQLILSALDRGAVRIIAGLGGSATVDGGIGACQALGISFLDADGRSLSGHATGRHLPMIRDIDITGLDKRLGNARLTLVCDVTNPLTGPNGAARVFGPQKGASERDVVFLENGLENLRSIIQCKFGVDLNDVAGSGAAGGCGGGLSALAGGVIMEGAPFVLDFLKFDRLLSDANAIVTGEGASDSQTLMGKLPYAILRMGKEVNVPVALVAGIIKDDVKLKNEGFDPLICINSPDIIAASHTEMQTAINPMTAALRLKASAVRLVNPEK